MYTQRQERSRTSTSWLKTWPTRSCDGRRSRRSISSKTTQQHSFTNYQPKRFPTRPARATMCACKCSRQLGYWIVKNNSAWCANLPTSLPWRRTTRHWPTGLGYLSRNRLKADGESTGTRTQVQISSRPHGQSSQREVKKGSRIPGTEEFPYKRK